jgi:FixJ family two-component response regulator
MGTAIRNITLDRLGDVGQKLSCHVPAPVGRSAAGSGDDSIVFIVDDDPSMREAVKSLLGSVGLSVQTFETAQEFLRSERPDLPCCLVLDVRLPGLSGLDLQRAVASVLPPIHIVFITAHADIPMSVQAMKAGAVEFLTKPFRDQQLIDAVQQAIDRDRAIRHELAELTALRQRYESLSPREHEVMTGVVTGQLNKQIAAELGTSEATVKAHRAQLMRKMEAESLAHLVRMAERLDLLPASVLAPPAKV